MRAGIGLISLLLGVGLMMYLFAQFEIPKAKAGKQLQEQAQQISGRGPAGEAASDSFTTQGQFKNSGIESLLVTAVTPGGAVDTYYGLRVGDAITGINGMHIKDISNGDEELAKSLVAEAFSKQQKLNVRRGGQMIELPAPPGTVLPPSTPQPPPPAAASAQPPAAPVPAPAPAPQKSRGLAGQLDAIQGAGGAEPPKDQ